MAESPLKAALEELRRTPVASSGYTLERWKRLLPDEVLNAIVQKRPCHHEDLREIAKGSPLLLLNMGPQILKLVKLVKQRKQRVTELKRRAAKPAVLQGNAPGNSAATRRSALPEPMVKRTGAGAPPVLLTPTEAYAIECIKQRAAFPEGGLPFANPEMIKLLVCIQQQHQQPQPQQQQQQQQQQQLLKVVKPVALSQARQNPGKPGVREGSQNAYAYCAEKWAAPLTEEQRCAVDLAVRRYSIFLTGPAGSGKSTTLRAIVSQLTHDGLRVSMTASTGAAALQIEGITVHSWAGIGLGDKPVSTLLRDMNPAAKKRWRETDCLILDEISMIDPALFERLEELGRLLRENQAAFGGLQVIACGDFAQLPPVRTNEAQDDTSRYLFNHAVWKKVVLKTLLLSVVHRQREPELLEMLESVREGRLTPEALATICATQNNSLVNAQGVKATKLFARNNDVDAINASELAQLREPQFDNLATDSGQTWLLKQNCKLPVKISLRVGAQVMLLVNKPASKLVNGSRGVVTKLPTEPGEPVGVMFLGHTRAFSIERETLDVPGVPGGPPQATRYQYPLRLAWATTIHKSQGCTIDLLECDLRGCFEAGQAYTALSRCSSLRGLRVVAFEPQNIRCSQSVADFYRNLHAPPPPPT
jgi:hypothetical protein